MPHAGEHHGHPAFIGGGNDFCVAHRAPRLNRRGRARLGASIAASWIVLLIGACVFGFRFTEWAEWEGRFVGLVGTVAGVAGALVGLKMALRAE